MKKAVGFALSLIFVFAFTISAFAAETADTAAPAQAVGQKEEAPAVEQKEEAKRGQLTGEIMAIDAVSKTLKVKGRKGEATFSMDEKTRIKAGKETKTITDLKVGDRVAVRYTETDDKKTAKSVKIKTDAKKSGSKVKREEPKQ